MVVSGRRDDEGQKLATELRDLGPEAEFVRADVPNRCCVQPLLTGKNQNEDK